MKKIVYILLILMFPCSLYADKKEGKKNIAQIKTYLKEGTNLDKAEELAYATLRMPEYKEDMDVYLLLTETLKKQYENKNMQLYLKTLKDTASIFPVAIRMFRAYESLDSVDATPDKKGRVKPSYRKKNSEFLNRYRPNLLVGGSFSMRHKSWVEAWKCVDTYLDCERQPLFSAMDFAQKDTMRYEAAYMALAAARELKRHDLAEKYGEIALLHPKKACYAFVELFNDAFEQKDTLKAVKYLSRGFNRFPDYKFFFPRLVDHYMSHGQLDSVTVIVDRALEEQPGNLFYRLAKNVLQLNKGLYDDCISLGDSLIHANDKMSTAYFNVGSAYYNKAIALNPQIEACRRNGQTADSRKLLDEQKAIYRKARPYLETYRQQKPDMKKRWAPMLYTIYLNLNMGKEFDELEKLLTPNS